MERLTIEMKAPDDGRVVERKGRMFSAIKLAHVCADFLWSETAQDDIRPVWVMIGGTPTELRPFLANLKAGRPAVVTSTEAERQYGRTKTLKLQLLKTAGYSYGTQRLSNGDDLVTAMQPGVCGFDVHMIDSNLVQMLALTPKWWVDQQVATLHGTAQAEALRAFYFTHLAATFGTAFDPVVHAPWAGYCVATLEQRLYQPLVADLRCSLYILLSGLRMGVFSLSPTGAAHFGWQNDKMCHKWAKGFSEVGTDAVGLLPGVVCNCSQKLMAEFLSRTVRQFLELTESERS